MFCYIPRSGNLDTCHLCAAGFLQRDGVVVKCKPNGTWGCAGYGVPGKINPCLRQRGAATCCKNYEAYAKAMDSGLASSGVKWYGKPVLVSKRWDSVPVPTSMRLSGCTWYLVVQNFSACYSKSKRRRIMFETHRRPVHFNACVDFRKTVVNITLSCLIHGRSVVFFFT